jgi:NAD(P)-dependent dehydrogenase (short-subunit alcohol dehydrogenase family)
MPYHYDRTGVRVVAMCPGVTDTPLISEAHHRQLRDDWGDEAGRELDELSKQK